jgi:hypothetical protein
VEGARSFKFRLLNRPWNGDYVFSSGDLVEDLTHNFFLETGARNGKLKVYEMVEHPAARALTGFLLVRGGVHQVAYARAIELLTGANLMKMFPTPRIPTDKIPECKPHIKRGEHLKLFRFSASDYLELSAVFKGPHPETGEELEVVQEAPEGMPAYDPPSQPAVFAPDYGPEEIAAIAERLRKTGGPCRRARRARSQMERGRRRASRAKRPASRRQLPRNSGAPDTRAATCALLMAGRMIAKNGPPSSGPFFGGCDP